MLLLQSQQIYVLPQVQLRLFLTSFFIGFVV